MIVKTSHFLTKLSIFVVVALLFSINVAKAQNFTFSRSLKVGSVGEDVRNLQKILNLSQDTAIRGTGIGSVGQESTFFGNLTKDAVIRFQEKYRNEILTPNGLSSGTGFVGPSTIALLVEMQGQSISTEPALKPTSTQQPVVSSTPEINSSSPTSAPSLDPNNPNQRDLDAVLAAIERVGKEQGMSADKIAAAKNVVIKESATTTDLNKKFLEVVRKNISKAPAPVKNIFARLWQPIEQTFFGKKAQAMIDTPFGGRLLFSMYCTQSQNWWIGVQPLPPSYATLLTYQTGSQIHLGYNIPITSELLGKYTFGAPCIQGICPFCVTMPSQGMISPNTGSSAI